MGDLRITTLDDGIGSDANIASRSSGRIWARLVLSDYPWLIGISLAIWPLPASVGCLSVGSFPWLRGRPVHVHLSLTVDSIEVVGVTCSPSVIDIDLFGPLTVVWIGVVVVTSSLGVIDIDLSGSLTVTRVGVVGGTSGCCV